MTTEEPALSKRQLEARVLNLDMLLRLFAFLCLTSPAQWFSFMVLFCARGKNVYAGKANPKFLIDSQRNEKLTRDSL